MQAIVRDDYGTSEILKLEEVDKPTIGEGDVLIRVHASSINAGDGHLLRGKPYLMRLAVGLFRPRSRGMGQDVAGRVEAVGAAVTGFHAGDEVFGEVTLGSTWAEFAVAPAKMLAPIPKGATFEQAAALPMAAMTALAAVGDHGRVSAGHRVLVNGASGGVGSYVVQIARSMGAEVTAVCSTRHVERARELGAAHVIDYTTEDFVEGAARYDVVLDVAGSRTLAECRSVLTADGTYVKIGGPIDNRWLGPMVSLLAMSVRNLFVRHRLLWFISAPGPASLRALAELFEDGKLVAAFDRRCTLSEVPAAMRSIENGQASGKIVVAVC